MEITVKFTAKQVFSWVGLLISIFIVFGTFLIFATSTDTTGAGMVLVGLTFILIQHFYLLVIPIVGLCLDVYKLKERRSRKVSFAELFSGLSASFLLFIVIFFLVLRITFLSL